MKRNSINIKFHQIECSSDYLNYLKQKVLETSRLTGPFSSCDILFSRREQKYKGVMTLRLGRRKSMAIFHGKSLAEVVYKLFKIARKNISRHSPHKFHHEKIHLPQEVI